MPQESIYLETTRGFFGIDEKRSKRGENYIFYAYEAAISPKLNRPSYARVSFEMPDEKNSTVINSVIEADQMELYVQSDYGSRWRYKKSYRVEVYIFSDEEKTNQIDYLEQFIRCEIQPKWH